MPTPQDPLEAVSIENLLKPLFEKKGPVPPMALPAEYAQEHPDLLGAEVDRVLGAYSNGAMEGKHSSSQSNKALTPYLPEPVVGNVTIPRIGRSVSLEDLTNYIKAKESTNNYTALNKEQKGNTASGAYQYTDATWNGYGGYPKAMLAPKAVQDRRFAEDIQKRAVKYGGDPFKAIAAHYLPAAANDPSRWTQPYKLPSGKVVKPVASYVAYVVRGTPLEKAFNAYIQEQQQNPH